MKLQKIFRRSFTRSSKDDNNTPTKSTTSTSGSRIPKLFTSRSVDETKSTNSNHSSPSRGSNGNTNISSSFKAPLAGKENSPDIDFSKKVSFRETSSPEGIIDNINHHDALFDDGVLKAFEVGNLSIAEFLESPHTSPDTTPNTTLVKREKESETGTPKHTETVAVKPIAVSSLPSSPMKKPSLLDQAHAKGGNSTARVPASPVLRKQIVIRRVSVGTVANSKVNNGTTPQLDEPLQQQLQKQKEKHRFSKSLEHLAQQVFGEEFQKHLEDATKQSAKVPISVTANESITTRPMLSRSKTFSPRIPNNNSLNVCTVTCPMSEPPNRRSLKAQNTVKMSSPKRSSLQRCHSASKQSDVKITTSKPFVMSARSVDIVCCNQGIMQNEVEPLESWDNKLDLSSRNSISSADVLASSKTRMLPVIEGEVMKSPRDKVDNNNDDENSGSGKERRRAKSVGSVSNSSMDVGRFQQLHANGLKKKKLAKADSEVANYGSSSEKDLSASESSVLDIQFPPPPPIEEGLSIEQIEIPEVEAVSFDWEVLSDEGGGGECCGQNSSLEFNAGCGNDALIESLMSIVPLPENESELQPALTKALGEIVSEIVSSRRKLNRLFKAIEIHQHILKEQSRKIESQTKEIAHLRLITFGLENGHLHNTTVKLRADHKKVRRPQSARTYRQSREMIELNYTLDKLLYQCSSLRQSSNGKQQTGLDRNDTSTGTTVRRSNSFPSRDHIQLKQLNSKSESEC